MKKFGSYAVNNSIEFWHWADGWMKGKIVDITKAQNYFVCITIQYRSRNGNTLETKIFREDWLKRH